MLFRSSPSIYLLSSIKFKDLKTLELNMFCPPLFQVHLKHTHIQTHACVYMHTPTFLCLFYVISQDNYLFSFANTHSYLSTQLNHFLRKPSLSSSHLQKGGRCLPLLKWKSVVSLSFPF